MDHNTYAVPFSVITIPSQPFSATYRIYVGDRAGNDIDPAAATTTTWTWRGPNQVIGPISFSPTTLVVGGTVTASATATSGLPVTFTSLTPLVCGVSGTTVTGLATGTCRIAADQAGNGISIEYAPQVTGTITSDGSTVAVVTLENLNQNYDGTAKSVMVTTSPPGLTVSVTYNGSATVPTNAGSYSVIATVTDPNYTGSASGTLAIDKATATVTLGSLSQTYDGTARSATATTNPAGKTVTFTYNGSATAPTNAGSYTVVGTISDANYQGSATGTLVIGKATATVTLGSLGQTYDGTAKSATATTTPCRHDSGLHLRRHRRLRRPMPAVTRWSARSTTRTTRAAPPAPWSSARPPPP